MITRPLDLQSHLKRPGSLFNPLPLLDIVFIALFFSLLASNFVLSPGLTINLPVAEGQSMTGVRADVVLTVRSDRMLILKERILNMDTLQPALEELVERRVAEGHDVTNLLVQFDREVSVQTLLSVSELAQNAGVTRAVIAAEPSRPEPAPVFP